MDKNNYSFTSYHIGANGDISYTVTKLAEDRRDRRMSKAELLKQLEELKKQIEALPDDEKKIKTLPVEDEKFFFITEDLSCDYEYNCIEMFNSYPVEKYSSIGNYFKSEEDARMVIKAMQLEQAIRIRRIELNDGWEPDWDDVNEYKYFIYTKANDEYDGLTIGSSYSIHYPIFCYYKSQEIARQIIDEFKDDLLWYFNEYYPNKNKMYVWGD